MIIFFGIIVAFVLFSVIVLAHEFGHFYSARMFGVKVYEFGLGIPPKLKKIWTDKKGTIYTLNWFPLGGFVRLAGESLHNFKLYNQEGKLINNEEISQKINKNKDLFDKNGNKINNTEIKKIKESLEENKASYSLMNKPAWQQAIVLLAGVFMNFLFAIIIFTILFIIGVKPVGINTKIKTNLDIKLIPTETQAIEIGLLNQKSGLILVPVKDSLASKSGIQEGDIIQKINGEIINNQKDFIKKIGENPQKELILEGKRLTPECLKSNKCDISTNINIKITPSKEGKIGSYIIPNLQINEGFEYKYGFFESIKYGTIETYNQTLLTFNALGMLGKKIFSPAVPEERKEAINSLSGPIGVVNLISKALAGGIVLIVIIGAMISINLGVFNLLPIPALDGGRLVFLIINGVIKKIFGKKIIGEKIESIIHISFFLILIILSILIAFNDVLKIINN